MGLGTQHTVCFVLFQASLSILSRNWCKRQHGAPTDKQIITGRIVAQVEDGIQRFRQGNPASVTPVLIAKNQPSPLILDKAEARSDVDFSIAQPAAKQPKDSTTQDIKPEQTPEQ